MNGKQVSVGPKPARNHATESWVNGGADKPVAGNPWTARLTIDVTPELRGRIKIVAFERGITVAEMLRELLQREYAQSAGNSR